MGRDKAEHGREQRRIGDLIGHTFEEEEELIPVEGGQPTPPTGKLYGLRALLPPALLLFYVVVIWAWITRTADVIFVAHTGLEHVVTVCREDVQSKKIDLIMNVGNPTIFRPRPAAARSSSPTGPPRTCTTRRTASTR